MFRSRASQKDARVAYDSTSISNQIPQLPICCLTRNVLGKKAEMTQNENLEARGSEYGLRVKGGKYELSRRSMIWNSAKHWRESKETREARVSYALGPRRFLVISVVRDIPNQMASGGVPREDAEDCRKIDYIRTQDTPLPVLKACYTCAGTPAIPALERLTTAERNLEPKGTHLREGPSDRRGIRGCVVTMVVMVAGGKTHNFSLASDMREGNFPFKHRRKVEN
ncbi:hypothetical protein A7U60_g3317 [Sanghuangporus baumii]|uniref:Uncharacterized protein n=1 Tax=Sanghuangporus baumii TaxID=108892 RepID=A0A9Q5N733_SANBA|nr:hypothetical protein A7U60_g3317 [Sanghuangporus baumii]